MFRFSKEFPLKQPYAPENFGAMATSSSFDTITYLDFVRYHTFTHVIPTISCIWVACSDLKKGTFSHIRSERSPSNYVRELSSVWGRERPGVVLIGARETKLEYSLDFAKELKSLLLRNNFRIAGEDLGGSMNRNNFEMNLEEAMVVRSDGESLRFNFI